VKSGTTLNMVFTAFYRDVDINIGRIALGWNMSNNNKGAILG
jgi:hypothetical protein